MIGDFVKLTDQLYRLLEFFPESDPLKHRAKDKALVIMENLRAVEDIGGWTSFQNEKIKTHILEDIDTLLGYLWIAKSQGWLNSVNYLIVKKEYDGIVKKLKPLHLEFTQDLPSLERTTPHPASSDIVSNSVISVDEEKSNLPLVVPPLGKTFQDRKEKIIHFLKEHQQAQVAQLQSVLPDVTKRTIRRDLDELLEMGIIERLGEFNEVFYKLKGGGVKP